VTSTTSGGRCDAGLMGTGLLSQKPRGSGHHRLVAPRAVDPGVEYVNGPTGRRLKKKGKQGVHRCGHGSNNQSSGCRKCKPSVLRPRLTDRCRMRREQRGWMPGVDVVGVGVVVRDHGMNLLENPRDIRALLRYLSLFVHWLSRYNL
jgi:hypothetical protein